MKRNHRNRKLRQAQLQPSGQQLAEKALLEGEYDPAIMDRLLEEPSVKALIAKGGMRGERDLTLIKGAMVLYGVYDYYAKKGKLEEALGAHFTV